MTRRSLASAPVMVTVGGEARHRDHAGVAGDRDHVVAGGAVDDDGVGLAVAGAAAGRRCQVEVDLVHVGAGQVVDGDGVGAAEGVEVDALDAVEVHRDVADVAGEPDAAAVGREVDLLGDVGAVEQQRVGAGLALDGVAAVAGVPDERVVAGAHEGHVVAAAADDQVVAGAADEDVVAVAAVEREGDLRRPGAPRRRWCRCRARPLTVSVSLAGFGVR